MIKTKRTAFACILVILFGFALFYTGTDGFRAYTAEAARVNHLNKEKPKFPNVTLEDSEGKTYSISEFKDKYVFITFIYTSCGTVCPQLEMNMAKVYDLLPSKYIGEDIVFLSISFDPARDDIAALKEYKHHFEKHNAAWRIARVPDQAELNSLLKAFGVIVIPDGKGNITHNAAFYLVDKKGNLANVMDYTKTTETADKIKHIIENDKGA